MRMRRWIWALLIGSVACAPGGDPATTEPLSAPETFVWTDQPLRFQPPPPDWRRDRYNQGGLLGVDFVHSGSVGERIYVAEYTKVGARAERENRRYRLEDVVEETLFSTEGWPLPADSFRVSEAVPDTIAGLAVHRLDFTLNTPERQLVGREYYLLENDHLFEAAFLGLAENLPLFERMVATIVFPSDGVGP